MKNLFENYKIQLDDCKISKLKEFGRILTEHNKVMNLTTVTDERDMWIKHFLDSLLGAKFFPENAVCCEIGSGGGFPSIPLKILRDDLSFTLIEATGKKCNYLNAVIKELDLKNMNVVCGRAEDIAKDKSFREGFHVVTARAVARLNTLCEYCLPFASVGGRFVAYKGNCEEELNESLNAVKVLGGKIVQTEKFALPDGVGERTVIVIEKVKNTPSIYPRGNGKERKNPL